VGCAQVTTRLRELHTTIEAGERHRNAVLQQIAFNLEEWTTKVRVVTKAESTAATAEVLA
jgi:hypothetical protein